MEKIKKYLGSKKILLMILAAVMVGISIGYTMHGDNSEASHPVADEHPMSGIMQPGNEDQGTQPPPAMPKEDNSLRLPDELRASHGTARQVPGVRHGSGGGGGSGTPA